MNTLEFIIPTIVAVVLAVLLRRFFKEFKRPSKDLEERLAGLITSLEQRYEGRGAGHVLELDAITEDLAGEPSDLRHLWREFRHTLHEERAPDTHEVSRYRQTVPSELFFSNRALVDVPLKADFFRHLPGILTGIGIIGTFGGLIVGLWGFDVGSSSAVVNQSVDELLQSVRNAFVVSAFAIAAAMWSTWYEKRRLTLHYRQAERLRTALDQMFDAGVGEAYLLSIRDTSAESATQLKTLRQGLVDDLKDLFEEMNEVQRETSRQNAELTSKALSETFQAPLAAMSAAIEKTQQAQAEGVQQLLEGTLVQFSERLEHVIGKQLSEAADGIGTAAKDLRDAISQAPDQISRAVAEIRDVLEEVAASTQPIVEYATKLSNSAARVSTTVSETETALTNAAARIGELVTSIGDSVSGAEKLAAEFVSAAEGAELASQGVKSIGTELTTASARMVASSDAVSAILERAEQADQAQKSLIDAVERAAEQLATAQSQLDTFLGGVGDALTGAHNAFGRELNQTLESTHAAFQKHLVDATKQLAGAVSELSEFVEGDFHGSVDALQLEMSRLSPATEA